MRRTSAVWVVLAGLGLGCAGVSRSSNTSGNSSGQSANSSGQSANSSAASNASSQNSSGSAQSSEQTRNSATSVQSSQASTNASSQSSGASSSVVAGSALLLGTAGGILTTVFTVKHRREARLQREQLRQLQQAPPPQPMQPAPEPPLAPHSLLLDEAPPTLDAMVLAREWLEANRLQLAQDLALGAGPTLDDLAGISGIAPEHRAHFGRLLQRHRAELLAPRELTPLQAAQVMSRVGDLVMADATLRGDAVATLEAGEGSPLDSARGGGGSGTVHPGQSRGTTPTTR